MEILKVKTPAKINFGLNVVEKRHDGFHNIETIFYPIDLFDELTFNEANEFIFESDNMSINSESDNLVIKAKNLLELKTGKKLNVNIYLKKNIPIGAGLGGGSSDAACTLFSLNKIFKLNLDSSALHQLALVLGSDVPFFLNPFTSFGSARGEILEQIDFKIEGSILLINPGIFISTKWAYGKIKPQISKLSLLELYRRRKLNIATYRDYVRNDFEIPVLAEFQGIQKLKEAIYEAGADFVLLSGSGSSVFSIFQNNSLAKAATEYFSKKYFTFLQLQ